MDDKFGFQDIKFWEPISVIKERVLDRTLLYGSLLAFFAFVTASFVSPTYAFSPGFYFDIGSLSGLFIVYALRNRLNLRIKLAIVIVFVFLIFLTSLAQYGTVSTQLTLALLIPFLTILAFNLRTALLVLLGVALTFTLIAYLYINGIIESLVLNPLNELQTLWVTTGIVLFVACAIIVLIMNRYNLEMNLVIKKLKKRDDDLLGHLEEKNVMIQEIHHRVKNNLAVVSGLLELQVLNIENSEQKNMLQKSVNRILSIAKVHEMLYQSDDFNKIPLKDYLDELTRTVINSMNSESLDIKYENYIKTEFLSVNKSVPLGIIFNELITNSIKYAFRNNRDNLIEITVLENDGVFHAVYKDNGVGIDDFDKATSKSLGFSLINSLLSQIDADYKYHTNEGFELSFSFSL
ncbi:MAG: sensor histidine kinase [Balneolaceae bacterium]